MLTSLLLSFNTSVVNLIYMVFTTKKKSGSTDETIGRETELPKQLTYMAYIEDSPSLEDELTPYIR